MSSIRVAGAQINLRVGDLEYNEARIAEAMEWAEAERAHLLLLPELAVCGYPPEDLLSRPAFVQANLEVVDRLARRSGETATVVGFADRLPPSAAAHRGAPDAVERRLANAAALLRRGRTVGVYRKVMLPNYGVFDEDRHFAPGSAPDAVWEIGGVKVGVSICEDIWVEDGPPARQAAAGAQLLVNINGSPFQAGKPAQRMEHVRRRAENSGRPVVYLNLVGGQDELVFDGASLAVGGDGRLLYRAPSFAEECFTVDVPIDGGVSREAPGSAPLLEPNEEIYRALTLGFGDYVRKNGFEKVIVGLSGGIDSALTATAAADALGAGAVRGVTMPSRFSSPGSVGDSRELAQRLGIRLDEIPIADLFATYQTTLEEVFAGTEFGVAEENLQSRIRGALLMALSNKYGEMVAATGNKSEMAVGYATLYGDLAGGFAVLKDVFKTKVYELARWRNRRGEVIPEAVLAKPPSAELRPGQLDTDSLPPYEVLDPILAAYIEEDRSVDDIAAAGADRETAERVARLVDRNEYKRRQAPPGVKISAKAFGRDRRLPITNGWRKG